MKRIIILLTFFFSIHSFGQQQTSYSVKDTAQVNLDQFAHFIIGNKTDNYQKAKTLLSWLSTHFE